MRAARKNEAWWRFVAAMLACALVIGNVVGGAAHALHGAGVHDHHGHGASASIAMADEESLAVGERETGAAGDQEAFCLDVLCHGGLAVFPTACAVMLSMRATGVDVPPDVGGADTTPAPLDRPPSITRS